MEDKLSMSQIGLKKHYEKGQINEPIIMPLGEWVESTCPELAGEIEVHAWECLNSNTTQHEMNVFMRCCMTSIRQEFEKDYKP